VSARQIRTALVWLTFLAILVWGFCSCGSVTETPDVDAAAAHLEAGITSELEAGYYQRAAARDGNTELQAETGPASCTDYDPAIVVARCDPSADPTRETGEPARCTVDGAPVVGCRASTVCPWPTCSVFANCVQACP
jgi:hypothetical protein